MSSPGGVIVVGVDGSPGSGRVLSWAENAARALDTDLLLVTADEFAVASGINDTHLRAAVQRDAEQIRDKALAATTLPSNRISTRIVDGYPGPALIEAADGARLLVVGSRGKSVLKRLLLGSESWYCVQHASCPVVVVP